MECGQDLNHSVLVCMLNMKHLVNNFVPISAQCPELQSPADGMVTTTSRRLSGSTATYTCMSGFELLDPTPGSDMRTCLPDGAWSGSEQQCIRKCLVSN